MDTRTKIVTTEDALRLVAEGSVVVSGFFDPMIAEHAERLAELKQFSDGARLLVAVAEPTNPILAVRARMELVAALACVDHVCEASPEIAVGVGLEAEDAAGHQRLVELVHRRQAAK